ncbi:MAG: cation:proton antiporter [Rickettsiales bacterium]
MGEQHFLTIVLLILSAAVVVVAIFKKLKLSPVLGYFVAGGLIGEHGLNYVNSHNTEVLGEVGVIFLLFAIGLELTFDRLKAMRRYVFGFGSLQVVITAFSLGLVACLLGESLSAAAILGGGLALSSTAIVLQVVAEKREQSTQVGRLSLAVLLMQDFAVVPLLVLVPIISGDQVGFIKPLGEAFIKAVLVLVFIFVVGRIVLRPMFSMNSSSNPAESNEIFIATTILIALGTAYLTDYMGLSLALGAFVAGLLVAETEFQIQAEESIAPFKGLFLGLFFMSVGMSINLQSLLDNWSYIALLSVGLIILKASIIILLALIFKFSVGNSIHVGLLLAQGSEFAFILFRLADAENIFKIPTDTLLLVVTITMAFTPLIALLGSWISKKLDKKNKMKQNDIYKDIADLNHHVIVLGFGRVGQMVARLLAAEKVNYIAVDINSEHVSTERQKGNPVYLGDASSLEMLNSIGIARASAVIISLSNEITLKKAAKVISREYPKLPIVVRAKDLSNTVDLYSYGASIIVPETYETGLQLGGAVLKSVGVSEFEVSRIKNQFRAGNYIKLPKLNDDEIENNIYG